MGHISGERLATMLAALTAPNVGMAVLQGDDLADIRTALNELAERRNSEAWKPISEADKEHGKTLLLWGSLQPEGPCAQWLGSWFQTRDGDGFWQVSAIRVYPTLFRAAPLPPGAP
jgi:hypothetical protein